MLITQSPVTQSPNQPNQPINQSTQLPNYPITHSLLTAAITLLAYLLTLEPDLSWANFGGDGGELITAAVTLGVPHPPGYPTYVLLGHLFSRLPLGPVAYRFNLLSALSTAVSAAFVTATLYHLAPALHKPPFKPLHPRLGGSAGRFIAAVSTGLAFALMPLVWSQAIIAEVYALNLAFAAAFLYLLLRPYSSNLRPDKGQAAALGAAATGLLLGLAITFHLTAVIFLPLALVLIQPGRWPHLLAGTAAGLTPFLLLPLLAQSGSPVIWSRPDTLQGWWWLVSAQLYRPNVLALPLGEWPGRFSNWGPFFLQQYAYIGLPLLLIGLLERLKSHPRLIGGLAGTAVLFAAYAFTYRTNDALVLLLPALLVLSILLGFGLQYLGSASIILPLALIWLNLGQPEKGYYVNQGQPVRPAAETIFENTPADAVLLTSGDPTIAALWYFHHVEGRRPDVIVIDGNQFQFDWYREQLGRDYPFLQHLALDDLPGFIERNSQIRPFCELSLLSPGYFRCTNNHPGSSG